MKELRIITLIALCFAVIALLSADTAAQNVKRVVIMKIDGLPTHFVDEWVKRQDRATGKSMLPWFDEVFYKNGTRIPNFYSRGMSLSGPAWGQLDTGQHLQIKGNVEYDRYTLHTYDYLNFFPYYLNYGLSRTVDMPAVEVLDQLRIPILADAFPYERRYTAKQLYQRGADWATIAGGFIRLYPGNIPDMIDEWTLGLDFRNLTVDQSERDIIGKVSKRPELDYYDYYDVSVDHMSHHNNDTESRFKELKTLDTTLGRIWEAISRSERGSETALVVVSDHGVNSSPETYSQGFNLVRVLSQSTGGGHHVATKRRLMLDYSIKGLYPLTPIIKSSSSESLYLKGQSSDYPTVLLDFDGNERSSIHLRNSDLNTLHIILQELQSGRAKGRVRDAAIATFFDVIDQNRATWQQTVTEVEEELGALKSWIDEKRPIVAAQPKKFPPEDNAQGIDKEARRLAALVELDTKFEADHRRYIATLKNLLSLDRDSFDPRRVKIADVIAPGAMGDGNSLYQMQNYVAGPARGGLVVDRSGKLDMARSFVRVNYFDLLESQRVRSNPQKNISNRPIDFTGFRLSENSISIDDAAAIAEAPIYLHGRAGRGLVILTKVRSDERYYKVLPVTKMRQTADGDITYTVEPWSAGFPLEMFEDANFATDGRPRAEWLSEWHSETDWMHAAHLSKYSNAVVGLNEQMIRHPLADAVQNDDERDRLIMRFRQRQRNLAEADLLIHASYHWNFDVRGFNPGGNHGSFYRVSTNATFMIAGGDRTGIPRGLSIERPYDSLSFVPTILRLMGKVDENNEPSDELRRRGFRRFPGRVVSELVDARGN